VWGQPGAKLAAQPGVGTPKPVRMVAFRHRQKEFYDLTAVIEVVIL